MSRFINDATKVVVSVADAKDDRFTAGWSKVDDSKPAGRKSKPVEGE